MDEFKETCAPGDDIYSIGEEGTRNPIVDRDGYCLNCPERYEGSSECGCNQHRGVFECQSWEEGLEGHKWPAPRDYEPDSLSEFQQQVCSIPDCRFQDNDIGCLECMPKGIIPMSMDENLPFTAYKSRRPYLLTQNDWGTCVEDCTKIPGNYKNGYNEYYQMHECQCEEGYQFDEDGFCRTCSELSPNCMDCYFSSGTLKCDDCFSDYYVLNSDRSSCVPKFAHCEFQLEEQTWEFFNEAPDDFTLDQFGNYKCPKCENGYFWKAGDVDGPGECVHCAQAMPHCKTCHTDGRCKQCAGDFILSADESRCDLPIENCAADISEYEVRDGEWACPDCIYGYGPDETGQCVKCSDHMDFCGDCDSLTHCLSCDTSQYPNAFLSYNEDTCLLKFQHCSTLVENYHVLPMVEFEVDEYIIEHIDEVDDIDFNFRHEFACGHCEDPYAWDRYLWSCQLCSNIVYNCDTCTKNGTCTQCQEGYFLSYDKSFCIEEYPNCAVGPEEYELERIEDQFGNRTFVEWMCPICNHGYMWETYEDTLGGCTAPCPENCNQCEKDRCVECEPGFMLDPTYQTCQRKIHNCTVALDDQPLGGLVKTEEGWLCPSCLDGYIEMYDDDLEVQCNPMPSYLEGCLQFDWEDFQCSKC